MVQLGLATSLQAVMGSELPTAGPFARLAVDRAQQPATPASATAKMAPAENGSAAPTTSGRRLFEEGQSAIETHDLHFSYPGIDGRPLEGVPPVVQDMSISLPPGSRCLLIGPNGAGKTTLLKILGGKHMVPEGTVRVLQRPPFHDTALTASGELSYLGGNWDRDIAFAGYSIPLQGDFPVSKMVSGLPGVDPKRKAELLEVLDIDVDWRMHLVSDGQRRRVQICMGLLKPFQVLLLDEITVDLDVLGRADMLAYLRRETEERKATIIYATHIFDGLESWPTHIMYLAGGKLRTFEPASSFPELAEGRLLELIEKWLRAEAMERKAAKQKNAAEEDGSEGGEKLVMAEWSNGWAPGRMTSSLRDSSNTVMRM